MLAGIAPGPVVALNHAVAVAMVRGPAAGLELLAPLLPTSGLRRHHRLHAVRGHLLDAAGDGADGAEGVRHRRAAGHQPAGAALPARARRRRALLTRAPGIARERAAIGQGGAIRSREVLMPLPYSAELTGRIDDNVVVSELLRDNPLGDPFERPLQVYVPPGYDDDPGRRYPSVYVLQGYTGMLPMWHSRSAFRLTFPEAVDQLFAGGGAPPCLVVFVDAWTAYGGSQFVDSPGTGRYHCYLCDEVVPFVDRHYRTLADPAHRG